MPHAAVRTRTVHTFAIAVLVAASAALPARAQAPGDTTRQLWDTEFVDKRPKPAQPAAKPKPRRYKPASTASKRPAPQPASPDAVDSLVGVTLWRLRPPVASDAAGSRMLVHKPAAAPGSTEKVALTPERIDIAGPLVEGQFVRLAIESPRAGHLYVVDREVYADGSRSAPVLIFPTTRLAGGANAVEAGRVVEIPAQTDDPEYLTVTRTRPDQVSEAITIIVAPEPIAGVEVGADAQTLKAETFAEWERTWAVTAERLELEGGKGETYTAAEAKAGADPKTLLTQDDPLPQTLYRLSVKKGAPVMVTIELPIRR